MKQLNNILLIDDDSATNYLHNRTLKASKQFKKITIKQYVKEALDYLKATENTTDFPELILVDLNMPGMNGWEFLDEYLIKINPPIKPLLFILSTSLNPDDLKRSETYNIVHSFMPKPLIMDTLNDLMKVHSNH